MRKAITDAILYGYNDEKVTEIAEAIVNNGTAFVKMHVEDDTLMVHVHPFGEVMDGD